MIIYNQSNVTYNYTLPDETKQSGNQDSNIVQTEVLSSEITLIKSSDRTYLGEGETALQTIVITNGSSVAMTKLNFIDVMTDGATFLTESVTVNGTNHPSYNPTVGFALPDISAGGSITITYGIIANNPKTNDSLANFCTLTYTVTDSKRGAVTYTINSNEVTIALVSTRLTIIKSVDKTLAYSGDRLTYTSVVTNTGTQLKTNLVFRDIVPAGTVFVAGSVTVDGVPYAAYNPTDGFPLNDLAVGASSTIVFSVTVI